VARPRDQSSSRRCAPEAGVAALLAAAGLFAFALLLAGAGLAPAQDSGGPCVGDTSQDEVERLPGPRLGFGINPAGEAGALGPAVAAVADEPPKTLRALRELRSRGEPFVVRLNRFFWSEGGDAVRRFLKLTERYAKRGFDVELQLRYHPRPDQEGRIGRWVDFVRKVVRRFGSNPHVVAVQVTNEVNLTFSPDSSDGAYDRARDALIRGVRSAHNEARRRGYDQLEIGFNWFYRTDPANERSFWEYLRDEGGPRFVRAVDWVGLDAYPGTFFPPFEEEGGEGDGMLNAMSQLRECFLPIPGIPDSVPIHVEENGWPTGPGRSYERQARAMRSMVRAVHRFRGTYNVAEYRWFDLRDHRTSSPNLQHHYGILEDDYSQKPAFATYERLVERLAG
jgi:hypothetical protein